MNKLKEAFSVYLSMTFFKLIFLSCFILGIIFYISRFYQLQVNISSSMPQRLWLTHVGEKNLKRGDYVIVKFHDFRMNNKDDFEYVVKQVGGIGGDKIIVKKWNSNAKGVQPPNKTSFLYVLQNKTFLTFDTLSGNHFNPLTKEDVVIPKDCYFVHGQHHPSFDSRYKEFGLICKKQIYGRTYPIF